MFGANAVNRDYTFTQSENRLFTSQISKAISNYVENVGMPKNGKSASSAETANVNINSDSNAQVQDSQTQSTGEVNGVLAKNASTEKSKELQFQVEDLFGDDEDSNGENGFTYDGKAASSITTSFDALAAALGVSGDKITKGQLFAFLQSLSSDSVSENSKEIAFVKSLIAKFDTISDGEDYITSYNGVNEPQDYETITEDQVTSPIDIRI